MMFYKATRATPAPRSISPGTTSLGRWSDRRRSSTRSLAVGDLCLQLLKDVVDRTAVFPDVALSFELFTHQCFTGLDLQLSSAPFWTFRHPHTPSTRTRTRTNANSDGGSKRRRAPVLSREYPAGAVDQAGSRQYVQFSDLQFSFTRVHENTLFRPSKLMMPVRSWSAALFERAGLDGGQLMCRRCHPAGYPAGASRTDALRAESARGVCPRHGRHGPGLSTT